MSTTITFPKLGELLAGNASRAHNRITKQATREELEKHHRERIPGHFTRAAHGRYGYKTRQARYRLKKQKRYGSTLDLVASGKSKRRIVGQKKVAIGGSGERVKGTLTMHFDWEKAVAEQQHKKRSNPRYAAKLRPRKKPNITAADMKSEVQRTTAAERGQIAAGTRDRYVHLVKTTTGARQQIKV